MRRRRRRDVVSLRQTSHNLWSHHASYYGRLAAYQDLSQAKLHAVAYNDNKSWLLCGFDGLGGSTGGASAGTPPT